MPDRPTPNHLFSIGARREEDNGSPRSKSPELETDQFPEAREIFASVRRMRYRSISENVAQRNPGSLCREICASCATLPKAHRSFAAIDHIDHLPQPGVVFAVETHRQTMQVKRARVVRFRRQGLGLADLADHDIREVAVQPLEQSGRRGIIETNHKVVLHEAVRMKVAVEFLNLLDGCSCARMDSEKGHFSLGDITAAHYVVAKKLLPARPVTAARHIHQDDRHELGFSGLGQGNRLQ